MKKINEEALSIAAAKLRKLRLTTVRHEKDSDGSCETVKSVFEEGLGGLYEPEAVDYALRYGIKYYFEALEKESK